ncbi:DUF4339 domain-containing protein [Prevotella sp. OH937_COT-195]|uniref:DUF4339 domain-containing protein n=1 Tax=Prevotella sp. OH937_COT-195 TaxID=2491051 RepID=UPI000F653B79|nr:DUF4339 domain-containing protein [Prevotella sp. OH937_COT-195]RRD00828.1 DUF4339 domain-containing protein [Prevotella sp. OH937_COT-195]
MEYYVIIDGRKCGPFSREELRSKFITPDTPVWRNSMADWTPARNIPEIADILQPEPTPPPFNYGGTQPETQHARRSEYIPMIPEDYNALNIFIIIYGFLCCHLCIIGSIFAIISYIKSGEMKTMHALEKYDLMTIKAAEVRKFHKLAVWSDVVLTIIGLTGFVIYILLITFFTYMGTLVQN